MSVSTSELQRLRSDLRRLRLQRQVVRWSFGLAGWCVALVLVVLMCLGLDLLLHLSRLQRVLADATCVGVAIWAWRRYAAPWLQQRETEIDTALLVEREHGIDSDLVAALQFDVRDAANGSEPLAQHVICRGAELSRSIDVLAGFSWARMRRPALQLTAVMGGLCVLALAFPDYATTFARRFLLFGADRYPSAAVIESLTVNGRQVDLRHIDSETVFVPAGDPLRVEVFCAGRMRGAGRGVLTSRTAAAQAEFPLEPAAEDERSTESDTLDERSDQSVSTAAAGLTVLAGEHSGLVDSAMLEVFVGDTWTDPLRIEVIPRPVIDVQLQVAPPRYAASATEPPEPGARQVSVLAGSTVTPEVHSLEKPLREVTLQIGTTQLELTPVDTNRRHWRLTNEATPLSQVTESLRYAIDVVDEDGLGLEQPWEGFLRIRADRAPRVALARRVSDPHVMPAARPEFRFGVRDDFGLQRIELVLRTARTDGSLTENVQLIKAFDDGEQPVSEAVDDYVLDLKPYNLVKGDEISVSLRGVDYRGGETSAETVSDPIVLKVTDRSGILRALQNADQQSAEQIDEIIRRELSLGDAP